MMREYRQSWARAGTRIAVDGGDAGSGPGASVSARRRSVARRDIDSNWLSYDSGTKTVKFKLIAGMTGGAKSPYNFNGFTDGEMTLVVPESATVVISFENQDGVPHIGSKRACSAGVSDRYTLAM